MLKAQDVLVVLLPVAHPGRRWTYQAVAVALCMEQLDVHEAVARLRAADLLKPAPSWEPNLEALEAWLLHGLRNRFPAERIGPARGIATAHSAPKLAKQLGERPRTMLVWPSPEGDDEGEGIKPLCDSAPLAALKDMKLYHLLALVDAVRGSRGRDQRAAAELLRKALVDSAS